MNDRGAGSLLRTKVKLGADASIAAGPKGRSAAADTDAYMRAEILSYSRARGVFAGISLEGSTLRPDEDANRKLYGNSTSAAKIISDSDISAPSSPHDRGPAKVISTTQALVQLVATEASLHQQQAKLKPQPRRKLCSRTT